jgi:hypothetical protein
MFIHHDDTTRRFAPHHTPQAACSNRAKRENVVFVVSS